MFGVERRGAPVAAFIRVDNKPIRVRAEITNPQYVLVLDPTLTEATDVTAGVGADGVIIVNSPVSPDEIDIKGDFKVITVDGTTIAVDHGLGTRLAPIVNTTMLGAFAKASGVVSLDAVCVSIKKYFPKGKNAEAATAAYDGTPTPG